MNTITMGQSLHLMEGLQKAIPTILEPGDFLTNLEISLKIIASTFSKDTSFVLTKAIQDTPTVKFEGMLVLEKCGDEWRELVQRSPEDWRFELNEAISKRLSGGAFCQGTYSDVFSLEVDALEKHAGDQLILLPLLVGDTLQGVLGLGSKARKCEYSEFENSILFTYAKTICNWIDRVEAERALRRERDQLRDILNFW